VEAHDPGELLKKLTSNRSLSREEMSALMETMLAGEQAEALSAAMLVALRMRGETVDEIVGAAQALRSAARTVPVRDPHTLVDTCGTGGDGHQTFNVSTASAIVAAAAGARVAKHGGRSVSGSSGSADVLESLGVRIDLGAEEAAACLDEVGLTFLFAPNYHATMKRVAPLRKLLGIRTLFNMIGPLSNPAMAGNQLVGVFEPRLVATFACALAELGVRRALVVHGVDGMDEVTISGPTMVAEVRDGSIAEYVLNPTDFGIPCRGIDRIRASGVEQARSLMLAALEGRDAPATAIVELNAGATLYLAGVADTVAEGVEAARVAIADGRARDKLEALARFGARSARHEEARAI